MNKFMKLLSETCRERLMDNKWVVSQSSRVGRQWLESAAREGVPVVNARAATFRGIVVDALAGPEMAARGVTMATLDAAAALAGRAWSRASAARSAEYLAGVKPGLDFFMALRSTIDSIRLAGLRPEDLERGGFESPEKGAGIAAIMREYLSALSSERLLDYAGALEIAIEVVNKEGGEALRGGILIIRSDAEFQEMERRLLDALPPEKIITLAVDEPLRGEARASSPALSDLEMMRHIQVPSAAPPPVADGSVSFFRAAGRVNEVREVLRRCASRGIPFDNVEILHTNTDAYVPLIYETSERFSETGGDSSKSVRATFAEGIPTSYSRPGRALAGWLRWVSLDYPQSVLVGLVRDGLLKTGADIDGNINDSKLADTLRSIPIGMGRDRYLRKIDEAISAARAKISRPIEADADEDNSSVEESIAKRNRAERRLFNLKVIRSLVSDLIEMSPSQGDGPSDALKKAGRFLKEAARSINELDNYSLEKLTSAVKSMEKVAGVEDGEGIDAAEWLSALPSATRVMGKAPLPGHLHVDSVYNGGHSGRSHTFIVGMDDAMFPGGAAQDPLLLDGEKSRVSEALPRATDRLERKMEDFTRLLCGLRGSVTLGYSCRDLLDDSEMFPSSALMNAFRVATGEHEADLETFAARLGAPVSFSPTEESFCLDETEWWMWRLLGSEKVSNAFAAASARFPRAGRGSFAAKARASSAFTEFDGLAPRAGADNNPFDMVNGPVVSSSRLELFGKCPLAYFFKYTLGIKPPDEVVIDPYVWLNPLETGSLLHEAFEDFYTAVMSEKRLVRAEDESLLVSIIEERAAEYKEMMPPPSEPVYEAAMESLKRTAKIFIVEELKLAGSSAPRFLEASIGLEREREGKGTPLDSTEPVELRLAGGRIRARGRIDRVDALPAKGDNVFFLWDYKTGGTYKYRSKDPFNEGRVVQHALYVEMAKAAIERTLGGKSAVAGFGFFFPSQKGGGERISWGTEELDGGLNVIDAICRAAADGAFIATNNCDDCGSGKFQCEYAAICRDVSSVADATAAKLANPENEALSALRELKNYE